MNTYTPARWVILRITNTETGETLDKVFAGWYGGYAGSDSWKLNSGNVKAIDDGNYITFTGHSGSKYKCHKGAYGMSGYMSQVYAYWLESTPDLYRFEILDEEAAYATATTV